MHASTHAHMRTRARARRIFCSHAHTLASCAPRCLLSSVVWCGVLRVLQWGAVHYVAAPLVLHALSHYVAVRCSAVQCSCSVLQRSTLQLSHALFPTAGAPRSKAVVVKYAEHLCRCEHLRDRLPLHVFEFRDLIELPVHLPLYSEVRFPLPGWGLEKVDIKTYIRASIYICIHTYIFVCTRTHIDTCDPLRIHISVYGYIHIYTCTQSCRACVCVRVQVCVCMCVCKCVCVCVCVCVRC